MSPEFMAKKRAEARAKYPGEKLWQCDGCGHCASYGSAEPPGPTACHACAKKARKGVVRRVEDIT